MRKFASAYLAQRDPHGWDLGRADVPGSKSRPVLLAQKMMRYSLDNVPGMITTGIRKQGRTHWVYGRYKQPCLRCRTLIAFSKVGSDPYDREVWWCPSCQPQWGAWEWLESVVSVHP